MWDQKTNRFLTDRVTAICRQGIELKEAFFRDYTELVVKAAMIIAEAFHNRKRLFIFGNGGSAADAQHIAAEFVNRFVLDRPALPAVALTTDTSIITSVSNDTDFKQIFSRQIEALGQSGDIAWGISTSGKSPNVIEGLKTARGLGLITLALTGSHNTEAARISEIALEVNHTEAARIQEVHIVVGHAICDLVDALLFGNAQ
jgi:D-sedoheptulose 7-phosphate isomerase